MNRAVPRLRYANRTPVESRLVSGYEIVRAAQPAGSRTRSEARERMVRPKAPRG